MLIVMSQIVPRLYHFLVRPVIREACVAAADINQFGLLRGASCEQMNFAHDSHATAARKHSGAFWEASAAVTLVQLHTAVITELSPMHPHRGGAGLKALAVGDGIRRNRARGTPNL